MRHGIVEGEPGIFPAPIARLFQAIGRIFRRRPADSPSSGGPPTAGAGSDASTDVSDLDPKPPDTTGR
jgi:hypothetical protein